MHYSFGSFDNFRSFFYSPLRRRIAEDESNAEDQTNANAEDEANSQDESNAENETHTKVSLPNAMV